jgi:hypothetical protein
MAEKQQKSAQLVHQTIQVQRELDEAARRAAANANKEKAEAFQKQVKEKNELWKQRAIIEQATRKGDGSKAARARDRQQELEAAAVAHREAEADAALFGEDSSDGEYDADAAAEDAAVVECAVPSLPLVCSAAWMAFGLDTGWR